MTPEERKASIVVSLRAKMEAEEKARQDAHTKLLVNQAQEYVKPVLLKPVLLIVPFVPMNQGINY
jgi:hypothetical protein